MSMYDERTSVMPSQPMAPDTTTREADGEQALRRSIKATLSRGSIMNGLISIAIAIGSGVLAGYLTGYLSDMRAAIVMGAMVLSSGVAMVLFGRARARALADILSRPVGMLLSQFEDVPATDFRWNAGQAMSRADVMRDLDLLQRGTLQTTQRNRQLIADLDQAREEANQQNLAKSQFLANMSHELRTPLNAILGYAMLLHEDAVEAKNASVMADLDRIQQAGRNLLAIINDILDLARIETGGATVHRSAIDIKALVDAVGEGYVQPQARNGNSFAVSIDKSADIMVSDQAKLRQCLNSLLNNAFKFTSEGNVELAVSATTRNDRKWIEFTVRDTGIGIAPDEIDGLFEAFQQLDGAMTRKHGGTGLGLAIVRRLAEMMGGECRATSAPGEGSTFVLAIPAGEAADNPLRLTATAAPAADDAPGAPAAEHNVLIIDDDEAAIELLRRWLVRMGYSVLSALDGETGIQLARTRRPDLILLDALLPGRSGYELMEVLSADDATREIPTILITVDDNRELGLRAGATDYLRKPISEQQLREVVDVFRGRVAGEVLVIDDDDDAADLVARCVAQVGFSSRRAANGAQGLSMATEKRPDAIVLDLAMPTLNGFDVLDQLEQDDGLRDVPLIVVSGQDISLEQHRRLAESGRRFLPKAASTPREIAQSLKELVA